MTLLEDQDVKTTSHPALRPWLDKQLVLALLLAAALLFPRSALVVRSQSERVDDEYHLIRGIMYLKRHLEGNVNLPLNDPPLGEGLSALPIWMAGYWPKGKSVATALYNFPNSADRILMLIGLWKVLLFLPMVGVIFAWCRRVYDARAAWLAVALLLVEPTLAAHVPLPTLDVLGLEGIVIGCWLIWRYFEKPTWGRMIAAAVAIGVALMLKHTAVILPLVAAAMGFVVWKRTGKHEWAGKLLLAPLIVFVTIWVLCFFDFATPQLSELWAEDHPTMARLLNRPLPTATYIGAFVEGQHHAGDGHQSYLFGNKTKDGVWYYFPVVATYKVPIGIGIVMLLGVMSLVKVRPRWEEWGLLIPIVAWTALMLTSKINIGWRHFLPAYVFMLMLATRVMLVRSVGWRVGTWVAVAIAGAHVLAYHPDYLSYINFPRVKPYLDISDSNVDWGQGLKAARKWIAAHPDRKVFVRDFGWGAARIATVKKRLAGLPNAYAVDRGDLLPKEGVLIISPVPLAGVYERSDPFRALREPGVEPDEILAHSMHVYDLDRLRGKSKFIWPMYKPPPRDEDGKFRFPAKGARRTRTRGDDVTDVRVLRD